MIFWQCSGTQVFDARSQERFASARDSSLFSCSALMKTRPSREE